jgi:hypothetical protein
MNRNGGCDLQILLLSNQGLNARTLLWRYNREAKIYFEPTACNYTHNRGSRAQIRLEGGSKLH